MHDILLIKNFLATITLKKTTNALAIVGSYFFSRLIKKPVMKGMPMAISVEPTTSCNLRCPQCTSGLRSFTRPTGMLSKSLFKSIIDELSPYLGHVSFYFQGEPLLNPDFVEMAAYATQKKLFVSTSTNAHYITPEVAKSIVKSGLQKIIVSIDGLEQNTYEHYRVGGQLHKVLDSIKHIAEAKKILHRRTPFVSLQYIVFKHNAHEVQHIKKELKTLEANEIKIKTAQVYIDQNPEMWIPENAKYARYTKLENGKYKIKNKLYNHCFKMWHAAVVTWDGRVLPCCFDKDAKYMLGSIQHKKFKEIWHGNEYLKFRKTILNSRKKIDICNNCSEGTNIWV